SAAVVRSAIRHVVKVPLGLDSSRVVACTLAHKSGCHGIHKNVNLLWRGIYVLYPGETVCLVSALSEVALPKESEGTVIRVVRDAQDLAVAAEVNFHTRSGALVVTVPLEALQAAVSRAGQDRTAVVWGLSKTIEEMMEAAMHSMLDSGFSMDRG